jgi:sulfide:quinone oxidoreductase
MHPVDFYSVIIYTKIKQMKSLVILGAGTAGTMMANHLHHHLKKPDWKITIIDEREEHHY